MLLSSSHCSHSNLSDHNQLRVLYCNWKGGVAPFPGVHHSTFPHMKPPVPSSSAVIPFCTIHRRSCLVFLLPQKFCVTSRFYPLTSSVRWFVSLLSCKGPSWPLPTVKTIPPSACCPVFIQDKVSLSVLWQLSFSDPCTLQNIFLMSQRAFVSISFNYTVSFLTQGSQNVTKGLGLYPNYVFSFVLLS